MSTGERAVKRAVKKKTSARKATKKTATKKAAAKAASRKAAATKKKAVKAIKPAEPKPTGIAAQADQFSGRGLLILSPMRLPLDVDRVAMQTARLSGLFFVIVGAFFTMWHANLLFLQLDPIELMAQAGSSTDPGTDPEEEPPPEPPEEEEEPLLFDTVRSFSFSQNPLSGSNIQVSVPFDEEPLEAYLLAQHEQTGETTIFDDLDSNGSVGSIVIDVSDLFDGPYIFQVLATYEANDDLYSITITDSNERMVVNETESSEEEGGANEASGETEADPEDTEEEPDHNESDPEGTGTGESEDEHDPVTTEAGVDEEVSIDEATDPGIEVQFADSGALQGRTELGVRVDRASYIELYVLQENTGTQRYLGQPSRIDEDRWRYLFDTTGVPNGQYQLIVNARTPFGFFTESSDAFVVANEVDVVDDTVDEYVEQATGIEDEAVVDVTFADPEVPASEPESAEEQVDQLIAAEQGEVDTVPVTGEVMYQSEEILETFRSDYEEVLQRLATAYRSGDQTAIEAVEVEVSNLNDTLELTTTELESSVEVTDYLKDKTTELVKRVKRDVETTNKIITDRTGVAAATDSDDDGITDFDEVTIYKTDPNVADSDGDGFVDGAEVLSGFNPTDSTPEVPVAYESPQEVGIVREDILVVETIKTEDFGTEEDETTTESSAVTENPVALITGKGLPNSFVTLYIFSTPIIVTVRTDEDGSWLYRFDKELEDGEHQVYVGITDNAGKIVAKSNPFSFVKEAQAFSATDEVVAPAPGTITTDEPAGDDDFTSSLYFMLLVASISIVSIGLVLIMVGIHLETHHRINARLETEPTTS